MGTFSWRTTAVAGAQLALAVWLGAWAETACAGGRSTVALVSLDGAPDTPREDFRRALLREFAARDVPTADRQSARYLVQAHLAALADAQGAELDYVLDVYDARRTRVARLSDAFTLKGDGNPWSQATAEALGVVAAKCADDVAAWLSGIPETR